MFGVLSDSNVPEENLYNHFRDNIYKPLAMKSNKKDNVGDTLTDLINPKESFVKNLNFSSDYGVLENFLL